MSYDDWKCNPPDMDEPAHCTCCETNQQRVIDLEEFIDWLLAHRLYWFATLPGQPFKCALMPYANTDTVTEGKTQREAAEKLWRERE